MDGTGEAPARRRVELVPVAPDEAEMRLDRWFQRRFPGLGHGRLEKLLRTGQVRIDGARARANSRLATGQVIRVPPLDLSPRAMPAGAPPAPVSAKDAAMLQGSVLHRDPLVLVLNKPPGLAVQGGSGVDRHLDGMLDALRFEAEERPRLVHRLDRDTSGILVLGRTRRAASDLAAAFRDRSARKVYWALVAGVPSPRQGKIDLPLAKVPGPGGERMMEDDEAGKRAVTLYSVLETAGRRTAWLALMPLTGRTHQLRAHCAFLGTPIVGDGKYGGERAFLTGAVSRKLHLHARAIDLPHPAGGRLRVSAPLPAHMRQTWKLLELDPEDSRDPFAE
ncbi:MAG: RluA family pseudouridine synthase [Alphaproteobacteria bacterium]|nr:RluA family pseudouridine synthase [Alphaproteobacteria bacterium]